MTQDIKQESRAGNVGEHIADTTANKPGLLAQLFRHVKGLRRGQTAAPFAACAECAAPEADPMPPVRGIERPHGRNFG
ncbi:MAG: hypothetical protein K0R10_2788 [Alphaproteobacteria bacterium]|nr:hypothetical protein [Alphaproteobacteria bacterium]